MIEFCSVNWQESPAQTPILREVSFSVSRGEWVFLVGPPQSGKSAILRLLMATKRPTSGQIFFDEREVSAISSGQIPYLRRKIGFVGAAWPLVASLSVARNLEICLRAAGVTGGEIEARTTDALRETDAEKWRDMLVRDVGGAANLRVQLARALANAPQALLLDDPTRTLAPKAAREFFEVLAKVWQTRGCAVLIATHDAAFVDSAGARVIRLEAGKIASDIENGVFDPNESQRLRDARRLEHLEFSPPVQRLLKHRKRDF